MAKLICSLSNGDKVYSYNKSVVMFFGGKRKVLTTSVYNGGYHEDFEAIYNYDIRMGEGMPCKLLADTYVEHMYLISQRLGLNPLKVSGMATVAKMENMVIETMRYKELAVTALVTAGIETNGGRVGDAAEYYKPLEKPYKFGTINIMLVINCNMPKGTLVRALVTCTEAKTAAIGELQFGSNYSTGLATGSGTDQTMVVANGDSDLYLDDSGKHSKMGELIGKVVMRAVKKALDKQSGLNPKLQHNAFRRLKRYGISPEKLWKEYTNNKSGGVCCSDEKAKYLVVAKRLAKDKIMLTYTALYVHLIDEFGWNLIDEAELQTAGQDLLDMLAKHYAVESVRIDEPSVKKLLDSWCILFNGMVSEKMKGKVY